jgi:PKD repeat protein
VVGIEVRVKYRSSAANTAQLVLSGFLVGSKAVPLFFTGPSNCGNTGWVSAGGASDLWGTPSICPPEGFVIFMPDGEPIEVPCTPGEPLYSLTTADFNAGNVGVLITQNGPTIDLDAIELVVHHASANSPPTADPNGPYTGTEGSPVTFDGTGSSDPDGDPLTYSWDDGVNPIGTGATLDHTYADQGSYDVCLTVDDGSLSDAQCTTATISNVAPTATFANSGPVDEGQSFTLSLTNPTDPSPADVAAGFEYAFDCGDGSGYTAFSSGATATCLTDDNAMRPVRGKIRDKDGGESEFSAAVEVLNVAPSCGPITAPTVPVEVNTAISASADFTDPGTADTHTALWDWSDGTTAGTVTQGAGSGSVADNHTYIAAGIHTVQLTVTDDDGGACTEPFRYVVVYDPSGGFVTGGGWIDSPAGAYKPDPTLVGKATFGFVSKYKKGAMTPTGNTEFQFKAGGLNFHSSSYDWLVVTGVNYARYKGSGTINGMGDYRFMLWAGDNYPDTFRIRIWTEDGAGVETDVYDNGFDQAIGGGSIVIHKK